MNMNRSTISQMYRAAAAAMITVASGCTRHHPIIMTPVRIDSAAPSATVSPATASRPIKTVLDDPLHRIDRMEWPGPNLYRLASGAPGPQYWQQRADYTIAAT